MKASKFTDAEKAFIIKQGEDRRPVAEICHKAQICIDPAESPQVEPLTSDTGAATSSWRNRNLQYAVALVRKEVVGRLDVIKPKAVSDHRTEVHLAGFYH